MSIYVTLHDIRIKPSQAKPKEKHRIFWFNEPKFRMDIGHWTLDVYTLYRSNQNIFIEFVIILNVVHRYHPIILLL